MRSPSSRVTINTVDIYRSTPGRDVEGGATFPYPSGPTYSQVPCTAQPNSYGQEVSDAGRITNLTSWRLMFAIPLVVNPRDKIVFLDQAGINHIIIVDSSRDEAGRGAAFSIVGTERT